MDDMLKIFIINKFYEKTSEFKIKKPKTFEKLLEKLSYKFKDIKENYIIFIKSRNNEEIIINNDQSYNLSKNILYVKEISTNDYSEKSMFDINFEQLPESNRIILEEKYNCFICSMKVKNEKPFFCYKCQKIYHDKCLNKWKLERNKFGECLNCPNCRNELPYEKWNRKLDYEEDRKNITLIMNQLNKNKNEKNIKNNKSLKIFDENDIKIYE